MSTHFPWSHASHWMSHGPVNRAMTLVLGVIAVSLLFSGLRVLDAAVSGALVARHAANPVAASAPDMLIGTEPSSAGAPMDASLVEIPEATAAAISL